MDIQQKDSHLALLNLMNELFRLQEHTCFTNMPVENILKAGLKKLIELKSSAKRENQLVSFCKQIKNSKKLEDLKYFQQTLLDTQLDQQTIKYIIQMKDAVDQLARFFINISENKLNYYSKPQLELSSLLRTLFNKSFLDHDQIQKIQDKVNAVKHKIFGWIKNTQAQQYIKEYNRRGQEIAYIKQDYQELKKIKEKQGKCFKQTTTQLQQLKTKIQFYQTQQKQLQRKLKVYQSIQIFQANQQQDQDTGINIISQEINTFVQLTETINFIAKEAQTQFLELKETEINTQYIQRKDKQTETDMKLLTHKDINTDIIIETQHIYASNSIQTQEAQAIMKETEVQTNLITNIDCQVQGKSYKEIFEQYQLTIQKKVHMQSLFQGYVFAENPIYRQRLISHIQTKRGSAIKQTRMIYRYDPLNEVNFHRYIDQAQGLLFIVKTIRGNFLAGFYSGKLIPDKILSQFGLLINLNKDQSYVLLQNEKGKINRAMVYDNYYAIFGNAQLRVKTGQDFIFSNFGIMNSYFNHLGKKVGDFLGEGINREAKFEIYEFYQVILQY